MSKRIGAKSIFGGPLSTRQLCKVAVQNVKGSDSKKTSTSTPMKSPVSKDVSKTQFRPKESKPMSQRRPNNVRPRLKPILSGEKRKINSSLLLPNGKAPLRKSKSGESINPGKGIKRKAEMDVKSRERIIKTPRVAHRPVVDRIKAQNGFHSQVRQMRFNGPTYKSQMHTDQYDDLDGFIDDGNTDEAWRSELRKVTNYDPAKFKDDGRDDRCMEVSLRQCWKEEQRSSRLGRLEDQREMEREAKRREIRNR